MFLSSLYIGVTEEIVVYMELTRVFRFFSFFIIFGGRFL